MGLGYARLGLPQFLSGAAAKAHDGSMSFLILEQIEFCSTLQCTRAFSPPLSAAFHVLRF
eukprot:COSAG02_NODE_2532_length_8593_cov_2.538969_5_plen_60_part_00